MLKTGSDSWWKTLKGPQLSVEDDHCLVTFWWRDPAGTEQTSSVRRVWLYITGVTDHHQNAVPQSLQRVAGTDAWCWQLRMSPTWRGSYCFIPSGREDDFAPAAFRPVPDAAALRAGWRHLLAHAQADPLNVHSWRGGRGHAVSALTLPQAPAQPGWQSQPVTYTAPLEIEWRSEQLNNVRRVWIYTTGEHPAADRPLAILLDGQFWAHSMPVWSALAALTAANKLPAAVYLLIDAVDTTQRSQELPCNASFWLALQQELLPQVAAIAPFSDLPSRTLVAGQSFGGLAALFAGLHWPERFGCVLSQSGSYWWPQRDGQQPGRLIQQLEQGELQPRGLRIWLEAGIREPVIFHANQQLLRQLQRLQQPVFWQEVDGGHDALCWRGGLTAGLMQLWQPLLPTLANRNDDRR
ncbi:MULTISPECIES: enterochelin esterase [unclassified Erwinia]|uniref:enterochelin esterase n=1 Tax=unclassified Erwinia TaxID=2622719 RepID=UPI000C1958AB|nr:MULTISPECIES: enterochelin esterase [unclassified Erwinia]